MVSERLLDTIPWVCYRRRNQWLRLALALFCLPLIWLARVPYHTTFAVVSELQNSRSSEPGPRAITAPVRRQRPRRQA